MAAALEQHWELPSLQDELLTYAASTNDELDATSRLIAALYANMNNFDAFRAISLLYFAAASFSETVETSGEASSRARISSAQRSTLRTGIAQVLERAQAGIPKQDTADFIAEVRRAIEPFDVAGLCAERAAALVSRRCGRSEEGQHGRWERRDDEIARMLERSGFYDPTTAAAKRCLWFARCHARLVNVDAAGFTGEKTIGCWATMPLPS